ncbi:MAG: hypothetical protein ACYDDB_03600 [bacterium]
MKRLSSYTGSAFIKYSSFGKKELDIVLLNGVLPEPLFLNPPHLNGSSPARSFNEIFFILPPSSVSYKLLSYPFKLKRDKDIADLSLSAIEELTPFKRDEINFIHHKITDNDIMVEYADKGELKRIKADLLVFGLEFKYIRFYSPYSLLLKITENLNNNNFKNALDLNSETGGKLAVSYGFGEESYALCFKSGRLADIVNAGPFRKTDIDPLKDWDAVSLNDLIREPEKPNPDFNFLLENPQYIDLYFMALLKKKTLPSFFTLNEGSKKFGLSLFKEQKSIVKIAAAVIAVLLFILLYNGENYVLKLTEKNALSQKINSVLIHYMPQKKVFYEPRYEIRHYYKKLKEKTDLNGSGYSLLNFINYIANAKTRNDFKTLKVDRVYYSLRSFSLSGRINGYNKLNGFEKYLKQKYNNVTVVKFDKNSAGTVSFRLNVKA